MSRRSVVGLCVALGLLLCGCGASRTATSTSQPSRSPNQALVDTYTQSPPVDPALNTPDVSRDIPAYQPDEESPLSYQLDGITHTTAGMRHYGAQGYSMVYDPATFTRQGWEDGDAYIAEADNYLSVSRINGMDAATVRQGLILQENIPDLGQQVQVGSQNYTAHTLVVSPKDGIFRQFWVLELAEHSTLLVEQSYVMDDENAALYQALQMAMLDTLTIE